MPFLLGRGYSPVYKNSFYLCAVFRIKGSAPRKDQELKLDSVVKQPPLSAYKGNAPSKLSQIDGRFDHPVTELTDCPLCSICSYSHESLLGAPSEDWESWMENGSVSQLHWWQSTKKLPLNLFSGSILVLWRLVLELRKKQSGFICKLFCQKFLMSYMTFHWLLDLGRKRNFLEGTLTVSWEFTLLFFPLHLRREMMVFQLLSVYYKMLNSLSFY